MPTGSIKITGGKEWQKALDVLKKNRLGLAVGIREGKTSPTGESVGMYAFFNEFGTDSIPSRPFMRKTLEEKRMEWARLLASQFKGRTTEKEGVRLALNTLGAAMQGDIIKTIKSNLPPPNSPETLRRKNASEAGKGTLIDTGALVHAIEFLVKDVTV